VDRIREKCRSCPYLPDCTGFAGCPIHDSHCRELHELMAIDSLKRMVEHEEVGITDGDDFIC
jgi:sulfatase maturation enzyme AslB (radical SAM superfamily)